MGSCPMREKLQPSGWVVTVIQHHISLWDIVQLYCRVISSEDEGVGITRGHIPLTQFRVVAVCVI